MEKDKLVEILIKEKEHLRNELQFLKNCQLQYFILSVAAAGAIAGFGNKAEEINTIYLAPLLVVLPCWWIFFDKSTTISRIVGYLRLLEDWIINEKSPSYIGWENSLQVFRIKQKESKKENYFNGFKFAIPALALRSTHKYWALNWWTFFGLGISALWMSFSGWRCIFSTWNIFLFLLIISSIHNLIVLGRLTKGIDSYDNNEALWKIYIEPK